MSAIEVSHLTRDYGHGETRVRALDDVSFLIEPGAFISVMGRSGSGKTTLLDLLGLLARPTSGTVRIDGVDTAQLSDRARADLRGGRIGFVFQEYNLLPSLSVLENVMLPLRYSRQRHADRRARARQLLDYVSIGDLAERRPTQLSGGQQQRVAIARALVNQPALILADEPTGALDTQTSQQLLALIRRLNQEEEVTFVVVTHDIELAQSAERMIRLKDGRIVSDTAAGEFPAAVDSAPLAFT